MKHPFTGIILEILTYKFGSLGVNVFETSPLIQYLNIKTRSANSGSKARGAFANHYALYVLVEDYISKGYFSEKKGQYQKYEGARFTDLFRRQRELPFGAKLQNHALNARLNDEFVKYFPTLEKRPIIRDQQEQRYWLNESLLEVEVIENSVPSVVNIAEAIIAIIDAYVATKKSAFEAFLEACREISFLSEDNPEGAIEFIKHQLQPNVDARVFEIVSYAILKAHYSKQSIFWGLSVDNLNEEILMLYKTGRTNANDGGIDFVMRPLGRFFQVTETIDVNKYFLDIDKIQRFPITFVIKTLLTPECVKQDLTQQAVKKYNIDAVVQKYITSVEEIINIPILISIFESLVQAGKLLDIMDEIIRQSRVEFNYDEAEAVSEILADVETLA